MISEYIKQRFLRFTISGLLAFCITLILFIGMMNLLGSRPELINNDGLDFTISYVKEEVEIKERKRQIKKPPEIQKTSQPPAVPRLNVALNNNAMIEMPNNFADGKNLNILKQVGLPGFSMNLGTPNIDSQGGLKAGVPPIYPPKALLNNLEGWVQVEITVNEMGLVDEVTVLNSKPERLFDQSALKAVKKWNFHQKKVNDKAVPYQLTQTLEFKREQIIIE